MSKTTTEMQLVPIEKLVPYVNNARTHSPEQISKLRSSLREFGFINPVIIDRDYGVIAGHGRILAAKEEGLLSIIENYASEDLMKIVNNIATYLNTGAGKRALKKYADPKPYKESLKERWGKQGLEQAQGQMLDTSVLGGKK